MQGPAVIAVATLVEADEMELLGADNASVDVVGEIVSRFPIEVAVLVTREGNARRLRRHRHHPQPLHRGWPRSLLGEALVVPPTPMTETTSARPGVACGGSSAPVSATGWVLERGMVKALRRCRPVGHVPEPGGSGAVAGVPSGPEHAIRAVVLMTPADA